MKDSSRWAGSFVFVLGLHAGAVGLALGWTAGDVPYSPPPAAVMIELAPLPAAPQITPNDSPPGPEVNEVLPEPEPPPPIEFPPPPVVAEVAIPLDEPPPPPELKPPPPQIVEKKRPPPKKPPPPKMTAPQAAPAPAPVAAAPMSGASFDPPSNTLPTWKGLMLRHLERHKRYPVEAQRARQEGVVYVRFTMSRDGRVLAVRIERSANVASLDQEGLDLLRRAQPLPALPSDQPGETLELVVPIQFYMRR